MTHMEQLPPAERKRQREALRRRMAQPGHPIWTGSKKTFKVDRILIHTLNPPMLDNISTFVFVLMLPGLRPGLLQKYQAAVTPQAKFEFLRAFILDPSGLSDITVEAEFVSAAEHDDASKWAELPLSQLRKLFQTPEEQKFLEEIVASQKGRAHPQDASGKNAEMRLYWVFKEATDVTRNKTSIGTKIRAAGKVPANKAAVGAVADGLLRSAVDFGGKGASGKGGAEVPPADPNKSKEEGKAKPKPKPKQPKVGGQVLPTMRFTSKQLI
eukprot:Skav205822  [mRNA]  locus=scaffold870:19431:20237:- [translate_table: standard]